ncbi:hypothetical protein EDD85DRAFT_989953 [Armillaria nabsnona]|nr:hypothetical protein EDD85DRAFT_989953 [Armillaria nabsnona]
MLRKAELLQARNSNSLVLVEQNFEKWHENTSRVDLDLFGAAIEPSTSESKYGGLPPVKNTQQIRVDGLRKSTHNANSPVTRLTTESNPLLVYNLYRNFYILYAVVASSRPRYPGSTPTERVGSPLGTTFTQRRNKNEPRSDETPSRYCLEDASLHGTSVANGEDSGIKECIRQRTCKLRRFELADTYLPRVIFCPLDGTYLISGEKSERRDEASTRHRERNMKEDDIS